MAGLLKLAFSAAIWWAFRREFSAWLYVTIEPRDPRIYEAGPFIFALLVFLCVVALGNMVPSSVGGKRWSDAILTTNVARRLIGLLAGLLVLSALAAGLWAALRLILGDGELAIAMASSAAWVLCPSAKIFLARRVRPIRRLLAARHMGLGGSARFSGIMDEWANPWRPGQILLGKSRYDSKWLVGMEDDRHVITIATSRSGKGRSVIIPNLLIWPGSALVIDPKGQNAAVTALMRGHGGAGLSRSLGQTVKILDPLGEITNPALNHLKGRFNPLDTLDPAAPNYVERVRLIADALVVRSGSKDGAFFDNAASSLIAGVIDTVKRSATVLGHERNLATVRGLLVHPDGPPLDHMLELGGLAQAGAAALNSGGENSTADVLFTAMVHTDWLDSPAMQAALSKSDFSLSDLRQGNMTIYLVLPPNYISIHARFLRLFVNLSLQAAADGRKGKHAMLFLLDEFYALGTLQMLSQSAGALAGYGVKLWPVIQNIGQIQELYSQNWETFLGNAGIWTVFAANDASTAKYLSERLGRRVLWRKMRGPQGFEWELAGVAPLRDPLELQKETSRASGSAAVFTETGEAFLLNRVNYDRVFRRGQYSPDPHETGAER